MTRQPFATPEIAALFADRTSKKVQGLLALRDLIFEVAKETQGVEGVLESLKWGQPAYRNACTRAGTTLRLGLPKTGGIALYVHCRTSLIADFEAMFPQAFTIEGNRAVHLPEKGALPKDALSILIGRALIYHASK